MKTAFVLMRSLQFRDGSVAAFPMAIFSDQADAKREGDQAARMFANAHEGVHQVLTLIGINQLGHRIVEVPQVEGAGLVVVQPGRIVVE